MHVMIDLETLGTHPVKAPIVQIAMVPFELLGDGPSDMPDFQRFVSAASNEEMPFNRVASVGTVKWWVDTNPKLLAEILGREDAMPLSLALLEAATWLAGVQIDGVWGNGPTFDISMLESAYEQAGVRVPWHFRKVRCCRTIFDIGNDDPLCWEGGTKTVREQEGDAHDARVDCDRQIRVIQQVYKRRITRGPDA